MGLDPDAVVDSPLWGKTADLRHEKLVGSAAKAGLPAEHAYDPSPIQEVFTTWKVAAMAVIMRHPLFRGMHGASLNFTGGAAVRL